MLLAPGYRPPAWLEEPAVAGELDQVGIRVLGRDLPIGIWSPAEGELPLLVAHDGPEYDELSSLTRYAGAMIERGQVPPFRVALLPPGRPQRVVLGVGRVRPRAVQPDPAGDRASTSPCPAFRSGWARASAGWPCSRPSERGRARSAACSCSRASFFVPRFDRHESGFPSYGRIVRFVRRVLRTATFAEPVPVAMTCGAEEENVVQQPADGERAGRPGLRRAPGRGPRPAQLHGLARRARSAPDSTCWRVSGRTG